MLWICSAIVVLIVWQIFRPVNIYSSPKPEYYDGPTMEEYWKKEAEKEINKLCESTPELAYNALIRHLELGHIDKETYETFLKIITDKIEIKI